MAYVSTQSRSKRATTLIAVTALEAAAIYGLIAGLTTIIIPKDPPPRFVGTNVPLPPVPVPAPADNHPKMPPVIDRTRDRPLPLPLPIPTPGPVIPLSGGGDDTFGAGTATGSGPFVPPIADPSIPAFVPKLARPRGRPGDWVSTGDYPSQDLREGNQGVVRFRLGVSADGRVTSCTVTGSSGFARLDARACDKLSARARFDPASDESGAKMAGSYSGLLRWSIPD